MSRSIIRQKAIECATLITVAAFTLVLDRAAMAGPPVKLNDTLAAGQRYADVRFGPDGSRVFYRVVNSQDISILFSAPSSGGAPVKLNRPSGAGISRGIGTQPTDPYFYVSPDGGQVYYLSGTSGREDLFAVPSGGGPSVNLSGALQATEVMRRYALSSDGSRLVYDTARDGGFDKVFSVPTSGGTPTLIASGDLSSSGGRVGTYGPIISADSARVFTRRSRALGGQTLDLLYSTPIEGGQPVLLLGPAALKAAGQSVDGSLLWYAAAPNYNAPFEYHIVPTSGGPSVQLSNWGSGQQNSDFRAWFNADGSRVVYIADQETPGQYDYFSVLSAGGTPVKLNGGIPVSRYDNPNLSPDGAHALFRSQRGTSEERDLFVVPIEGGEPRQVNDPLDVLGRQFDPFFVTRDGRRVIYQARHDGAASNEIFSASLEGGASVVLNGSLGESGNAYIKHESPDSSRLVFIADREIDEFYDLYVVPTSGGTPVKLFAGREADPMGYSPDGSRLAMIVDGELYTRVMRQRWLGGAGNWDALANWNLGEVPDEVMQIDIAGPANVVAMGNVINRVANEVRLGGGTGPSTLTLDAGATISAINGIVIESNGTLNGNGFIIGDLANAGLISPGASPGTLNIDGDYSQSPAGKLFIELGGAMDFDRLQVAGHASIGGELEVALVGFTPSLGNVFEFLTAPGGISGNFTTLELPRLSGGLRFDMIYGFDSVSLTVVAVPEPASFALVCVASLTLTFSRHRTGLRLDHDTKGNHESNE